MPNGIFHAITTHAGLIGGLAALSLVMFVFSLVAIPMAFVLLPPDYLTRPDRRRSANGWIRTGYFMVKNIIGWVFIIAGIVMLFIPGQGLLSILIGLMLIHFPGKRKVIRRIMTRPNIFRVVNGIRVKAGKPPLIDPEA